MEGRTNGPIWLLTMTKYSASYKTMTKRSGTYMPTAKMRKLNASSKPITVMSTNSMKSKTSKAFAASSTARRMSTHPASNAKHGRAVSAPTSGRLGAAKSFKAGAKGDTKRVMQVSPAQRSGSSKKLSSTVAKTPVRQNKTNITNGRGSKSRMMKSLRKTMGY
jgi:hypothetical protein